MRERQSPDFCSACQLGVESTVRKGWSTGPHGRTGCGRVTGLGGVGGDVEGFVQDLLSARFTKSSAQLYESVG